MHAALLSEVVGAAVILQVAPSSYGVEDICRLWRVPVFTMLLFLVFTDK